MSGECDKCEEHILECTCKPNSRSQENGQNPKDKFYYQGKFFEDEDEFWAYVKEFTSRQTREEDFNNLFDMLKKDIWMKLSITKTKISNGELISVLEDVFLTILKKYWKENGMDQS